MAHRGVRRTSSVLTCPAAGVTAHLHVWEAMPHGGFGFDAPEMAEMRQEFDRFLGRQLAGKKSR